MTIRREDLAAAASLGLLQYNQVDPLLIFLLQRDLRERQVALAASARATPVQWLRTVLSYVAAFLAVLTLGMFGVLHVSRIAPSAGLAALVLAVILYTAVGVGLAVWSRGQGHCRPIRVTLGVVMASVPLAVLALHGAAVA
ncbi:MAG TPA: hypothetical protein VIM12_18450 [Noviherbaspirillum sp.]|uniref:hypothetical protein n=1 Tax=Noviherbaspirillum sp. TaxID=1926288 RepID=UPI002F948C82